MQIRLPGNTANNKEFNILVKERPDAATSTMLNCQYLREAKEEEIIQKMEFEGNYTTKKK